LGLKMSGPQQWQLLHVEKDDQVTITKLLTRSCFHYIVFTIPVRFLSFTQKTNSGITL
jgi:hypothetical protein